MKTKKKIFKSQLNFSKAELAGEVHLGAVGVNLPMVDSFLDSKQYDMSPNWLQLGSLFGSVNDPKFYDNIKMEDVIPKEEDFLTVPFRLLSATTVGAGTWKAADFSDAKILKKSMNKLNGKPLYKDHETDLDNWVGIIKGTKWSNGFNQDGVEIPAGIDGLVAIDAKTNPKIARGVLMGSIFSNSVTVVFHWTMSHDFEDEWEFYEKIGKMGTDGKMVRRIVTEIEDYHESSLVWLGADPFAKAITEDGSLKHPDLGSVYSYAKIGAKAVEDKVTLEEEGITKDTYQKGKKVSINFALDKNVLSLADKEKYSNNSNKENKMDKFIVAFIAAFGLKLNLKAGDKPTEDEMIAHLASLSVKEDDPNKDKIDAMLNFLKTETGTEVALDKIDTAVADKKLVAAERLTALEQAEKDLGTLKTTNEALSANAKIGEKYTNAKREEAINLYKKTVGTEKVEEAVVGLFNKANADEVDGLLKQYTKGVTEKFSGSCAKCGSEDFKFQSSFTSDKEDTDDTEDEVLTAAALREKYSNNSMNLGRNSEE